LKKSQEMHLLQIFLAQFYDFLVQSRCNQSKNRSDIRE
jgi:hypothetical protein